MTASMTGWMVEYKQGGVLRKRTFATKLKAELFAKSHGGAAPVEMKGEPK
jgi:hypothetical protein